MELTIYLPQSTATNHSTHPADSVPTKKPQRRPQKTGHPGQATDLEILMRFA